jgi:hypothetical protein
MQQTERRKIALVDWPELFDQDGGNRPPCVVDGPAQLDCRGRGHNHRRWTDQPAEWRPDRVLGRPRVAARRSDDEEELPGERIEEPRLIAGIAMQRNAKGLRRQIDCERDDESGQDMSAQE